jgi:hypothetical protein
METPRVTDPMNCGSSEILLSGEDFRDEFANPTEGL